MARFSDKTFLFGNFLLFLQSDRILFFVAGVMGIESLRKGFVFKSLSVPPGGIAEIGTVSGLFIIRDTAQNALSSLYLVDEFHNEATFVAGVNVVSSWSFSFSGKDTYNVKMLITNNKSTTAYYRLAYQNLA